MKTMKLIAAMASTALTAGLVVVMAPAANAATPPYEPDPSSFGTLTFYNSSGAVITTGSTSTAPLAAYVVGSAAGRAGDSTTLLNMAQPNPNSNTGLWNKDTLVGSTSYPLSSTGNPANIVTLSQTHPVSKGTNLDLTIDDFIGEFPNTDPSGAGCAYAGTPAGCTNAAYENLYQLRLITANGANQNTQYEVADVMVNSSTHTWTQVYPATGSADNTSLTIAGPSSVKYKASAKLTTVLKDSTTNHPIGNATVTLKRRPNSGAPWTTVGNATTNATTGAASKSLTLTGNTQFEWTYAGNSSHLAKTSSVKSVSVSQVVTINSTKSSVAHGVTFKIWGTVNPASSGQKVTLQHEVGTTWHNVATATIKSQALPNGKTQVGYVFNVKESSKGTFKFRVEKAATSTLAKGDSPTVSVKVT